MSFLRIQLRPARQLASAGLMLIALVAPATATTAQPLDQDVYPREDAPIERLIAGQTVGVRPIKHVKTPTGEDAVAERIIVAFKPAISSAERTGAHTTAAKAGAGKAGPVLDIGNNTYLVDVSGAPSLQQAMDAYRADPRVRFAEFDLIGEGAETPNDTNFSQQWGMSTINAPTAWNRTHGVLGSTPRRIAILDSGINVLGNDAHAELTGKVIAGNDFTNSSVGEDDALGHGTHVAGIAAAATNDGQGVAGAGYDAQLLNGKVLDDNGKFTVSRLARGIRWAADAGADVINMSLQSTSNCNGDRWEPVRDALAYAWDKKAVIVAAASNFGNSAQRAPGACPNVVAVANTTQSGGLNSSSSRGDWVELAAPGTAIFSTAVSGASLCGAGPNQVLANCSGTSMASPLVAGVAALVQASCALDILPQQVIDRLTSTAVATSGTEFGRIDASKAVCFPLPTGLRTGTITGSSIEVRWSDPTPAETRFEVGHRPAGGTFTVSNVSPNVTSFTESSLSPGSRYEYRVRACDNQDCSAWSNSIEAVVGGGTVQVQILNGRATVSSNPAGILCGLQFNNCVAAFSAGPVVLSAHDHEDESDGLRWEFDHWEGDCSGTSSTCSLPMTGQYAVKAFYTEHTIPGFPGGGGHR
jgi:thermitase